MRPLSDLFTMAEAGLIADSMEVYARRFHSSQRDNDSYSPSSVIEDIQNAIRDVHMSGILHKTVVSDMPTYIQPSKEVPDMLSYLRHSQKRTFLCTNRYNIIPLTKIQVNTYLTF